MDCCEDHRKVSTLQILTFFKRSLQCSIPAQSNFNQSNCVTHNKKHSNLLEDTQKKNVSTFLFFYLKKRKEVATSFKIFLFSKLYGKESVLLIILVLGFDRVVSRVYRGNFFEYFFCWRSFYTKKRILTSVFTAYFTSFKI